MEGRTSRGGPGGERSNVQLSAAHRPHVLRSLSIAGNDPGIRYEVLGGKKKTGVFFFEHLIIRFFPGGVSGVMGSARFVVKRLRTPSAENR